MKLFQGDFSHFYDIWLHVTIWNIIGLSFFHSIAGITISCIFKKKKIALLILLFTSTFGAFVGFIEGTIYAIAISLIYQSGPFTMSWYMSIVWGLGLSLFNFFYFFC